MAADPRPLASLSLTHVSYDPTDPVAYLCAWLALVPQALCIIYVTLIWSTREVEIALLFCGQLACEGLNFALKRLIKEERPSRMNGKGYGMPSSHAQFAAFFGVSIVLFMLVRHSPTTPTTITTRGGGQKPGAGAAAAKGKGHHGLTPLSVLERLGYCVVSVGGAAAVAWSRIYLNYHTDRQVVVGCAAGAASAVAWFGLTAVLRRQGWVFWLLEAPVMRWFRIRDLVVEEDPCQAGWEKWEGRVAMLKAESLVEGGGGKKKK